MHHACGDCNAHTCKMLAVLHQHRHEGNRAHASRHPCKLLRNPWGEPPLLRVSASSPTKQSINAWYVSVCHEASAQCGTLRAGP